MGSDFFLNLFPSNDPKNEIAILAKINAIFLSVPINN